MASESEWRTFSDQELQRQYSPSEWVERMEKDKVVKNHIEVIRKASKIARKTLPSELGISYGPSSNEKVDMFAANSWTKESDAPIYVYIHGGYWQLLSLEDSSFMAPMLTEAGAIVVSVGYDLAPKVNMGEIVDQVKKAVAYVLHIAKRRNSRGVYLCGHSAGAHLAAMMLHVDWMREFMLSAKLIKGAFLVSGIYDVRPLVKTTVNKPLKMSEEDAWQYSPARVVKEACKLAEHMDICIAFGEKDSPEFHRQSKEYAKDLKNGGVRVKQICVQNTDHFDVIEGLQNKEYTLSQAITEIMELKKGKSN